MFTLAQRPKLLIITYYVPIITCYQSTAPEPRCCWQKYRRCMEKKLKFILSYIKSFEILDKNTPKNISEQSQRQVSHWNSKDNASFNIFFLYISIKSFFFQGFWGLLGKYITKKILRLISTKKVQIPQAKYLGRDYFAFLVSRTTNNGRSYISSSPHFRGRHNIVWQKTPQTFC